jgi:bifunctional UDP-N-acetylglucosamine pyrophosphorylase/glucosamine-1-phosphate N-acetyltransferase
MTRLMIIPAAGRGTRLNTTIPKVLYPVAGRPMIDHLFDLYAGWIDRFVLVVHPSFEQEVRAHCAALPYTIDFEVQTEPTGMLDAILIPHARIRSLAPAAVWITWCDQVAISSETVALLADKQKRSPRTALVLPTIKRAEPYIHFERDEHDDIVAIKHRREGDDMPAVGESDVGLFALSRDAYVTLLPEYAKSVVPGEGTRERNFLPFIAWLRGRAPVSTFSAHDDIESVGVNSAEDLARIETHFRLRAAANA